MDIEAQARDNGWVPKEDFEANPHNEGKKWRTAEEFMDRKSLFDKIDDQHREIRKLQQGYNALQQHSQQIEQKTRERLLKELREEKALAVKEGDVVKIEEIRDRIEEVKEMPVVPVMTPQVDTAGVEKFNSWKNQNQWYDSNQEMRAFADAYGVAKHQEGKLTREEILVEVSKAVKMAFPQKFRNANKETAPPIEESTNRKSTSNRGVQLDEMQEKIWKDLSRAGVPSLKDPSKKMTREEYIENLR
jgi:hypothetical protein